MTNPRSPGTVPTDVAASVVAPGADEAAGDPAAERRARRSAAVDRIPVAGEPHDPAIFVAVATRPPIAC